MQQRSGLQTGRELSGSETETETDSESYEEEDTDAAGAMGGLPESGRRAGGQERGKRQGRQEDGGPRSKIPAGAVRVLPSMGGREEEGEGRELGEEEESTTWDRYVFRVCLKAHYIHFSDHESGLNLCF